MSISQTDEQTNKQAFYSSEPHKIFKYDFLWTSGIFSTKTSKSPGKSGPDLDQNIPDRLRTLVNFSSLKRSEERQGYTLELPCLHISSAMSTLSSNSMTRWKLFLSCDISALKSAVIY